MGLFVSQKREGIMKAKNLKSAVNVVLTVRAGFTLIELLVVVIIIGILAAIALPQYQRAVMKSKISSTFPLLRSIADAEERHKLATGSYTEDIDVLDINPPGSCSGDHCQVGKNYLILSPTVGSIGLYFDSTSTNSSAFMLSYVFDEDLVNKANSDLSFTLRKGYIICVDRNVERFSNACQSFSPVHHYTNRGGGNWIINGF
jgi:prepilin-type N-terminal cleavage/methylation domain-containing protein